MKQIRTHTARLLIQFFFCNFCKVLSNETTAKKKIHFIFSQHTRTHTERVLFSIPLNIIIIRIAFSFYLSKKQKERIKNKPFKWLDMVVEIFF